MINKFYEGYDNRFEMVYGVKFATNELEIIYDRMAKLYTLSLDTYALEDGENENSYILNLLDRLTQWMKENNHNTEEKIDMYDLFEKGHNVKMQFKSIEKLYATFKLIVKGFVMQ